MPSSADRDVAALREALAASTVRLLLDARAGRLDGWPATVRGLAAQADVPDPGEAYQRLLGPTRTGAGVYYTPTWLVEHLLDAALGPVLDDAATRGADAVHSAQ